tara:strand:- start:577 stop:960 length:384 start_codon:yes stop_codon:yes gene_type:complete
MKLTENFALSEFRCKDGTDVPPELVDNVTLLAKNLQILRQRIGKPLRVVSGYRSPAYNKKCGGTKKSQHMQAKAADLRVSGMSSDELHSIIVDAIKNDLIAPGGVGWYPSFVHYDVRGRNARWKGSK